jgi:hypothetical protein
MNISFLCVPLGINAHIQRLVSVVIMATVLEYTTED